MITLGAILLILGLLLGIGILTTLGVVLLAVGVVLVIVGYTPYAIGGRRHWW